MPRWSADERYTRLVAEHGNELFRLAVMLTANRHDAEDVVQDVLISVASAWPVNRPLPYLKRAVANRSVDILRKRREIVTDTLPERGYDEPGFLKHEQARRFYALLQQLPDRQRETLILRYDADLDDHAIAKILGVSVSTVRSQAQSALAKLRALETAKEEL
jgi:RNA polymerase sigma factor (sigma-70 family)